MENDSSEPTSNPWDEFVPAVISHLLSSFGIANENNNPSSFAGSSTPRIRNLGRIRSQRNSAGGSTGAEVAVIRPELRHETSPPIPIPIRRNQSLVSIPSVQSYLSDLGGTPDLAATAASSSTATSLHDPSLSLSSTPTSISSISAQQAIGSSQSSPRILAPLTPHVIWDNRQCLRDPSHRQAGRNESQPIVTIACNLCHDYFPGSSPWKCPNPGCTARFCKSCIDSSDKPECPFCKQSVQDSSFFLLDSTLAVTLGKLSLRCRYKGCSQVLPYGSIGSHEETCDHALVMCKFGDYGCNWKGPRGTLLAHEASECRYVAIADFVDRYRALQQEKEQAISELKRARTSHSRHRHQQQQKIDRLTRSLNMAKAESEWLRREYNRLLRQQQHRREEQEVDSGAFGPMEDLDTTTQE